LGDTTYAGYFDDGSNTVSLSDGTYAINAVGNSYLDGDLTIKDRKKLLLDTKGNILNYGNITTITPVSSVLNHKIMSNSTAQDTTAGIGFATSTATLYKSAIAHQRKGSNGFGNLVVMVDKNTDTGNVAITDEVMRFSAGLVNITKANVTFAQMTKFNIIVLPACNSITNASMARNRTCVTALCNGIKWKCLY
jgi:hypothetical protein